MASSTPCSPHSLLFILYTIDSASTIMPSPLVLPTATTTLLLFLILCSPSVAVLLNQSECATSSQSPSPRSPNTSSTSTGTDASPPTPHPIPRYKYSSGFASTIQSTISEISSLVSTISSFSGILGSDLRLSSAVSDCLDLLDLSASELSLTLNPTTSSGNLRSDLRSWLSAALGNQDTCRDSLSGTSSLLASLVGAGLNSVTSLVAQSLAQVVAVGQRQTGTQNQHSRKLTMADDFPEWVGPADRSLLQAAPVSSAPDAVVAADGTGRYTTVQQAIEQAPLESDKRFVIYVKRGVYRENVEIKKKKWNVMLVGDGMDQTVISGSRNFIDGWTTYRSATVGK